MVMEFSDVCSGCCEHPVPSQFKVDMENFHRNLSLLSPEDISAAIQISRVDIMNQLSQLIHCVGCRHRFDAILLL